MPLVHLLDLRPARVLTIKELLVRQRVNSGAVQHLLVYHDHGFESDNDEIEVQLVERDHERVGELLLRDQQVDQVSES